MRLLQGCYGLMILGVGFFGREPALRVFEKRSGREGWKEIGDAVCENALLDTKIVTWPQNRRQAHAARMSLESTVWQRFATTSHRTILYVDEIIVYLQHQCFVHTAKRILGFSGIIRNRHRVAFQINF